MFVISTDNDSTRFRPILLFFSVFAVFSSSIQSLSQDSCYDNVQVYYNDSTLSSSFDIMGNSSQCVHHLESQPGSSASLLCSPGLLTVHISPISKFPPGAHPHVELNVSVIVHNEVDAVYLRLHCLDAPNKEDVYCHRSDKMIVNNRWLWPCRGLVFSNSSEHVQVPFQFGYSCFRLYGLSQYMINITLFPQNCVSSYLITTPVESDLFPAILAFYDNQKTIAPKENRLRAETWSPMVIVDLTDVDGVWFRVQGPRTYIANVITIELYELSGTHIETYQIKHPSSGVKWHNAPNGEYRLYAYIARHDCVLDCSRHTHQQPCVPCVYTTLNFTLSDDRTSVSWRSLRAIKDSGGNVLLTMLGILITALVVGAAYLLWLRRHMSMSHRDIELVERKSVLVVYSDDCAEHSAVVLEFSSVLRTSANATVFLDQTDLISTGIRPSRWLIDCMERADRVLVIVSPCTQSLLDGRVLAPRRPYPDMFSAAVNMVISECTTNNRNRFAVVLFDYSPCTPYHLSVLNMPSFIVPAQLPQLTAFIHGVNYCGSVQQSINSEIIRTFDEAVRSMVSMARADSMWMHARLQETPASDLVVVDELENAVIRNVPLTSDDMNRVSEQCGILPPDQDKDSDEESAAEVHLLPPDSDSSSDD